MKPLTGKELKELRKEKGLSESVFARCIGVTKKQLNNFEYRHPSRKLPKWLLEKLECPQTRELEEILGVKKFKLWEWLMNLIKK